jgi:hypothetical protein
MKVEWLDIIGKKYALGKGSLIKGIRLYTLCRSANKFPAVSGVVPGGTSRDNGSRRVDETRKVS